MKQLAAINNRLVRHGVCELAGKHLSSPRRMPLHNQHARGSARQGAPLIVHSHLRWDFVWQRPQQLLTRIAATAPVLFLEEPVFLDDVVGGSLDITVPNANVHRVVPLLPSRFREDYDAAVVEVRNLMLALLADPRGIGQQFAAPVQWFYTPMPAPTMLGAFDEIGVVYDCMDELSQFRFAHPDLIRRERLLMSCADIVFTGGRKLYESKARLHDNVHFFGCGVDCNHFARVRDPNTPIAADVEALRQPGTLIAGYYGVIDERLDYGLIAHLAQADPSMHVVMVGPTAKIDPLALPQHPNLHWLGARAYDELPSYVRGFDVCIMPFALNEATEYINPTKTLEYLAAAKPVVSTAVADVVRTFAPFVSIAHDTAEFVHDALNSARHPSPARVAAGLEFARKSSWESVVAAMSELMDAAVRTPHIRPIHSEPQASRSEERRKTWPVERVSAATPATA